MYIATLILFCALLGFLSIIYWSLRNGIGPTSTSLSVGQKVLELLPPLPKGALIVELGVGWGYLLFLLARHYPHCRLVGYESSPIPYCFVRLLLFCCRAKNVELYRCDFWDVSLYNASLVCCYLYPGAMERLDKKISNELKKDSWICTHTFALPTRHPEIQLMADDLYRTPIYLYRTDGMKR